MSLETTINLKLSAALVSALDLNNSRNDLAYEKILALATGTGSGQADMIFHDQRTLGSGANEDLDLAGVLTGPLGNTLTFARIKALLIFAATANTTTLTVTRPATAGAPVFLADGDGLVLSPGGLFLLFNPSATAIAVTATTDDVINILNSAGASAVYDVIVVGASA